MRKKILAIDDELPILDAIETIFEDMGYDVETHANSAEGEAVAAENDYDLILIDIKMPGKDGAEITRSILRKKPEAKILIVTGYPGDPLAKQSLDAGAMGLVKKPFDVGKILDFLDNRGNCKKHHFNGA